MSSLREDVEIVRNHARVLKAIIGMADEIDSAEKLEVLVGEARSRLKSTQEELDAKVSTANAALKSLHDKISKAEAKGKTLFAEKQKDAAALIAKAESEAAVIVSSASDAADHIRAEGATEQAAIAEAIASKQAELAGLDENISAASAKLQAISEQIEAARATIKQMIGG